MASRFQRVTGRAERDRRLPYPPPLREAEPSGRVLGPSSPPQGDRAPQVQGARQGAGQPSESELLKLFCLFLPERSKMVGSSATNRKDAWDRGAADQAHARKRPKHRTSIHALLISGSKVRVLDGPPIFSGASGSLEAPELFLVPNWCPRAPALVRAFRARHAPVGLDRVVFGPASTSTKR